MEATAEHAARLGNDYPCSTRKRKIVAQAFVICNSFRVGNGKENYPFDEGGKNETN